MSRFNKNKKPSKFLTADKNNALEFPLQILKSEILEKKEFLNPDKFNSLQKICYDHVKDNKENKILWIQTKSENNHEVWKEFIHTMTCLDKDYNLGIKGSQLSLSKIPSTVKNLYINMTESKSNLNYAVLQSLQDNKWSDPITGQPVECSKINIIIYADFALGCDKLFLWRYTVDVQN